MAVKKYKPTTPGQRNKTGYTFEEITKKTPERSLIIPLRKSGGRNAHGRVTVRHRGGGHRRFIRIVDFKRDKLGVPLEWQQLNMIRIERLVWHCFSMQTAQNDISWPHWVSRLAIC